jgi:hypothetical protein
MVRRLHDQAFSQTRRDPLLTPAALQKAALSGGSPGWRHERGSGGAAVVGLVSADWPARRAPCIILEQSDLRAEADKIRGLWNGRVLTGSLQQSGDGVRSSKATWAAACSWEYPDLC